MQRQGFTRVEAVALVAVFGVLGAVVLPAFAQFGVFFPVFARARENAQRASCQSNLKQVGLGLLQYTQDYDEMYPPATGPKGSGSESYDFGWASKLQPYLRSTQLYQCPSDKHTANADATKAGYTDYWYNRNFSRLSLAAVSEQSLTFINGDGDGGSAASNARYNLNVLPASWWKTPGSPVRRHLNGGNYAFADGHVKWMLLSSIGKTTGYGFKAVR